MIIDYEAFIGNFAFRRVPNSDVPGLLKQMDGEGIDRALVSALECVTYRNVQAGNELLAERLEGAGDHLMGAAVVNPAYPRAAEDARICLRDLGMVAIRLLPTYHGYTLGEEVEAPGFGAVMSVAADLGVPVSILFEIEDDRQHQLLFQVAELAPEEVAAAIRAFPEVTFVLERASPWPVQVIHSRAEGAANWCVDIASRAMLGAAVRAGIADVLEMIGRTGYCWARGMAMQYPRAPYLKLDSLELDGETLRRIKGDSAARLLGM